MINIAGAFKKSHILIPFLLKNKNIEMCFYDGVNFCRWNGGRINENNNFKDFMFNVSFDLKNNSGVEGKLYLSDLNNNRLASSKGGMVSLSNVKYDFNKNSILNVFVDSLYIDDRQTISFSMTNIRLMIWGR